MPPTAVRTERTEARLLPEQKVRIERAAALKGMSRSDFMIQTADEAAMRVIQEHESWALEGKDRGVFVQALLHPPAPGSRLQAAARRYKARLGRP